MFGHLIRLIRSNFIRQKLSSGHQFSITAFISVTTLYNRAYRNGNGYLNQTDIGYCFQDESQIHRKMTKEIFIFKSSFISLFVILFSVFIVFIMFIAICVPLAGISVCICKICDNFDNLHFPSRSVLGWKVFYCSILLFCIGIVAERIVTCAIATTLLHSAVKGIFPQAETLVYEASKYIDELGPKMINVKGELQDHLNEYDETIEKLRGEFDQKTQAITDETTSNFIIFNSDLNEILVNGSNRVLSMESEIQQIVFDIFRKGLAQSEHK